MSTMPSSVAQLKCSVLLLLLVTWIQLIDQRPLKVYPYPVANCSIIVQAIFEEVN